MRVSPFHRLPGGSPASSATGDDNRYCHNGTLRSVSKDGWSGIDQLAASVLLAGVEQHGVQAAVRPDRGGGNLPGVVDGGGPDQPHAWVEIHQRGELGD